MIRNCHGPEKPISQKIAKACSYYATVVDINLVAGTIDLLFHMIIPPESEANITLSVAKKSIPYNNGLCHLTLPASVRQSPLMAYKVDDVVRVLDVLGEESKNSLPRFVLISTVEDASSGSPKPPGSFGLSGGFFKARVYDMDGYKYYPSPSYAITETLDKDDNIECSSFEIVDKVLDSRLMADSRDLSLPGSSGSELLFINSDTGPLMLHDFMVPNLAKFENINTPQRQTFTLEKPEWGKQFVVKIEASGWPTDNGIKWTVFENGPRDFGTKSNINTHSGELLEVINPVFAYNNMNDTIGFSIDYDTGIIVLLVRATLVGDYDTTGEIDTDDSRAITVSISPLWDDVNKTLNYPISNSCKDEAPFLGVSYTAGPLAIYIRETLYNTRCSYVPTERPYDLTVTYSSPDTGDPSIDNSWPHIQGSGNAITSNAKTNGIRRYTLSAGGGVPDNSIDEITTDYQMKFGSFVLDYQHWYKYSRPYLSGTNYTYLEYDTITENIFINFFDLYHDVFIITKETVTETFHGNGTLVYSNTKLRFLLDINTTTQIIIIHGGQSIDVFTKEENTIEFKYIYESNPPYNYCTSGDLVPNKEYKAKYPVSNHGELSLLNVNMYLHYSLRVGVTAIYSDDSKSLLLTVTNPWNTDEKKQYYIKDGGTLVEGASRIFNHYGFNDNMYVLN